MWNILAQPISNLWGKLLVIALPWLQRFLFNTAVKRASRGALKKTPLNFYAPNLIVALFSVLVINGIHFSITLWFTDSVAVSLISAGSVTLVTAFFLLRGFFCDHTKRERVILLILLIISFGMFVFFRVVIDIPWLALVIKLTMEVIFCFAVMLSELNRLNTAQSKAIDVIMKKLRISPDKFIGKMIIRFFVPKNTLDDSAADKEAAVEEIEEIEDTKTVENENATKETQ